MCLNLSVCLSRGFSGEFKIVQVNYVEFAGCIIYYFLNFFPSLGSQMSRLKLRKIKKNMQVLELFLIFATSEAGDSFVNKSSETETQKSHHPHKSPAAPRLKS